MKILFLLISLSSFAQEEDVLQLYTSLKEVTIFEDLSSSEKFKSCTKDKGIEIGKDVSDEKLDSVSQCFLKEANEEELLEISKNLGLKSLRLIKDNKAPLIRKYLENKIMEGLYGNYNLNQNPELNKSKKYKVINQATFLKLYHNHVLNSLYMSQAKYCLKQQAIDPDSKSEVRKIVEALENLQGKNTLSDIWTKCKEDIKATKCAGVDGPGVKLDWTSNDFDKSTCALKHRLRQYRVILAKVEKDIKTLTEDQYASLRFEADVDIYDGKSDGEGEISDIASLTSYDAYKTFEDSNPKFFEDRLKKFDEVCNLQDFTPDECKKYVNQKDMETFNKLKVSVMSEFNLKKKKVEEMNREQLLASVEVKLLTEKEKEILGKLTKEKDIQDKLNQILENYKIALISELNEKLKAKMASTKNLSSDNALDEIRFGLENEKEATMGLLRFKNVMAQYQVGVKYEGSSTVQAYTIPVEAEIEDMKGIINDKNAYSWVENSSGKFKKQENSSETFKPSEDFFNQLFLQP